MFANKHFLEILDDYDNLDIIGSLHSDTVLYNLKPDHMGKLGRPIIKGDRLDYKNFNYTKENDFFVTTIKCITNLRV